MLEPDMSGGRNPFVNGIFLRQEIRQSWIGVAVLPSGFGGTREDLRPHDSPTRKQSLQFGAKRDGKVFLGSGVWVKLVDFEAAQDAQTPSMFVRLMSEAVWTRKVLANKKPRAPFELNKMAAVERAFKKWLEKGYPQYLVRREMGEFKTYLNRAKYECKKSYDKSSNSSKAFVINQYNQYNIIM